MQQTQNNHRKNNGKVVYLPKRHVKRRVMAQPQPASNEVKASFNARTLIIFALGIVAVILASVPLVQAYKEAGMVTQELQTVREQEKEAMQENIQAQEQYKHMQDPEYLADVARRDYYYSKPGEIIFDLSDDQE